jgi:AraC-like DNA-binding protein
MPLAKRPFFLTGKLDQARAHLSSLFWPHELSVSHNGNRLAFQHNKVNLSSLSFNALQYGSEVNIDATPSDNSYLVKFTLAGNSEVHQLGNIVRSTPGTVCVMNPSDHLHVKLSENHNQLTIRVGGNHIHDFLERELERDLDKPVVFLPFAKSLSNEANGIARMLLSLCDDLNEDQDWYDNDKICNHLEEMLISLLLTVLPHSYSQLYLHNSLLHIPGKISHVQEYINSNFQQPIGLRELAVISQSSVRSLQMAFKKELDLTPTTFIRNKRLEHAYALLSSQSSAVTVTEAALESGFTHLGKFSHYYKLRYNELPSTTFQKAKK